MSELPNPSANPRTERSSVARWLCVAGAAVFLLAVVGGGILFLSETEAQSATMIERFTGWAEFALFVAVGLALAGLLVGLASMLRLLSDVHAAILRLAWFQQESNRTEPDTISIDIDRPSSESLAPDADATDTQFSSDGWRQVVSLLEDIRDNSLLSDEERSTKRLRIADDEMFTAASKIRTLTNEGDFAQTREIAEQVLRKYPGDERARELMEQVESSREQHESDDVQACTKQANDLISISSWSRARSLAQELQMKHPDSVEARQLMLRIEREHRLFEEEQKRRMNAEVQRFVSRRRWEEALAAARTFIERFPGCEEAEAVRMQLPTLETNAEIEARQHLEARIMELVRQGRYIEGVELAKIVIERYPDSPQAEALREQLNRLEELAQNPDAAPARIRTDS